MARTRGTLVHRRGPIALALLTGVIGATVAAAAGAQIRFEPGATARVGIGPRSPVTGDFTEDGILDLAVLRRANRTVTIIAIDAAGGLTPLATRSAGIAPESMTAADFDGDGHLDLAVTDPVGDSVLFFFGDGRGDLPATVPVTCGRSPVDVAVTFLGPDRFPDVVVACSGSRELRALLFGGGRAPFTGPVTMLGNAPASLVAAELTGDGIVDLVIREPAVPRLVVYAGVGGGRFSPGAAAPILAGSGAMQMADLDADGALDVVMEHRTYWSASVAWGDGLGGFARVDPIFARVTSSDLALADFDGDDVFDIALSNASGSELVVIPGLGAPPRAFAENVRFPTGRNPSGLATLDADGDGGVDVVTTHDMSDPTDNVLVALNRTAGLCARGTVNAGAGPPVDVLFVNDSAGGAGRAVALATYEPLTIFMSLPPSATRATPFSLYAWAGPPGDAPYILPFRIGATCLPTPLTGGNPAPRVVWNNTGSLRLGAPTRPSSHAPSLLLARARAFPRPVTAFVQGIIRDAAAPNGRAAATNGVTIVVR